MHAQTSAFEAQLEEQARVLSASTSDLDRYRKESDAARAAADAEHAAEKQELHIEHEATAASLRSELSLEHAATEATMASLREEAASQLSSAEAATQALQEGYRLALEAQDVAHEQHVQELQAAQAAELSGVNRRLAAMRAEHNMDLAATLSQSERFQMLADCSTRNANKVLIQHSSWRRHLVFGWSVCMRESALCAESSHGCTQDAVLWHVVSADGLVYLARDVWHRRRMLSVSRCFESWRRDSAHGSTRSCLSVTVAVTRDLWVIDMRVAQYNAGQIVEVLELAVCDASWVLFGTRLKMALFSSMSWC